MDTVVLDQHSEPWVATFTGLGSVHVHADGNVDVTVAGTDSSHLGGDPVESPMMREQALRWGWGEPLALVRRGFRLLRGTALVSPDRPGCLIVTGQPDHTAMVAAHLLAQGWSALADGLVPAATGTGTGGGSVSIDGEVMAHPRSAPVLLPHRWAHAAGLGGEPVRADTDAVAVDVARAISPQPVVAMIHVRIRRPHDDVVQRLSGFEPFEQAAATLIANPALRRPGTTPAIELANHSRLAALCHAEAAVRSDTLMADLDAIVAWWEGLDRP